MLNKILYCCIALVIITGVVRVFISFDQPETEKVMCAMDAMQCPDGSSVGRSGPTCEFVCPPVPTVPADVAASIDAKADLVTITTPIPNGVIESPLVVTGSARGTWFFEGSFPVTLTNWDGLIIAEGFATAAGEWMTTEFVPFTAVLEYTSPYPAEGQDFMKRGTLILKKDNPSGLPEYDDALEIPIRFAP